MPAFAVEQAALAGLLADRGGDPAAAARRLDLYPEEGGGAWAGGPATGGGYMFSRVKRGVSETLGEGDYEAHYDLGIAYKEMGLFDDAISEFHIAMGNSARETECVHLIALCSIESGKAELASELIILLGGSLEKTVNQDYVDLVDKR